MGSRNVNANVSSVHHRHHHHRHHHTNDNAAEPSKLNINPYTTASHSHRVGSKHKASKTYNSASDNDDEMKQYLKMLVDEMQAMKVEMNKIRQTAAGAPKGRSDSLQFDIKEMRSQIDLLRSRIAMTPKISEK